MDADRLVASMSAGRERLRALLRAGGVYDQVADVWLEPLTTAASRFEILPGLRVVHWLATLIHESAGFTRLEENLNYSAQSLFRLWPLTPNRPWGFTEQEAAEYARKPELIANRVYADRMGNGNEASGEGWFYRGRDPIQTTGRSNYQIASGPCGVDLLPNPELLLLPEHGAVAAAHYWQSRHCNALADADNTVGIRKVVNGGSIGLPEVTALVAKMKA